MRFDLPSKLAFVLFLWVCAFILDWHFNSIGIFLLILMRYTLPAFRPISPHAVKTFRRFLVYSLGLTILIVGLNAFFVRGGQELWSIAGFSVHSEGLHFGVTTVTRLLLLSFALLLFFSSTPIPEFIRFLQRKGLPSQLVLVLLLTLHFLNQLPERINQIFVAQEARGALVRAGILSRVKAFFPVLTPLVLSSISESIDRGMALELRGFMQGSSINVHVMDKAPSSPLAWIFVFAAFSLTLITVLQWLFV